MTDVTEPVTTPEAPPDRTLLLSTLMRRTAVDAAGQAIGRLTDIIVRLREDAYPAVTGLVAHVGGREVFVPAAEILVWDEQKMELASARPDLRQFARRLGEVLLRADVLGHRLVDVEQSNLVTAHDVRLAQVDDGWVATAVDIHPRGLLGRRGKQTWRDWSDVEALIGHDVSLPARARLGGLRRLKPAQLADLIEEASDHEQQELLSRVHAHPELEADVFEELDPDKATRLFGEMSDAGVAGVLARMRADDAADAVAELRQSRRRRVLDLLPAGQRTKVITLMGFNPDSAGGLMSVDVASCNMTVTAAAALAVIAAATTLQPEALIKIHVLGDSGELRGVASVIRLLQADPTALVSEVMDADPVRVAPAADLTDVALLMADYNLTTIPVVDDADRVVGVVTVDDILEYTIPEDWRRREPAPRPLRDALQEGHGHG